MKHSFVLGLTVFLSIFGYKKELRWDWNQIKVEDVKFPKDFLWGAATAAYQIEGHIHNNNWSDWGKQINEDGKPRIKNGDSCGVCCDHWNKFKEDFQRLKDLNLNSYRFSIEWSRIEPEPGAWDQSAIDQYKEMCKELLRLNITPVVTIHHFTHPLWFEKLGAFEKKENIKFIVRFAEKLFEEFSEYVNFWCTINEPAVYAAHCYFLGEFPPGKKDLKLASIVLENLLESHVQIYKKLKSMPGGTEKKIGIVKQILQFDAYNRHNPLDRILCRYLNHIFNETVMEFLKTGKYRVRIPFIINYKSFNFDAPKSLDFVGLNYYSHATLKFKPSKNQFFEIKYRPEAIVTDLPHSIYPEGLYRALQYISELNTPIYITENGIADGDDSRRKFFLKRYLWAISKALEEGMDIRGYFYWSLIDNFEWSEGFEPRFGLYHLDYKTQERILRPSSLYLKQVASRSLDN